MAAEAAGMNLGHAVALLAAGVVAVPVFRKLGLGSVLGYLAAGLVIGPFGLKLFADPEAILHVAELGVVLFLFIIGLEMRPSKLWSLRGQIFGLGAAQVLVCCALLSGVAMLAGLPPAAAVIGASGFVLSSTAVIMKMLDERGETATEAGQRAVSILLLEDLAVVPLLALVVVLGTMSGGGVEGGRPVWLGLLIGLGCIAVVIAAGRWLLNPFFQILARTGAREIMTAAALLVVLGTALFMQWGGLSMAMGAFLAGVLLSESTFRFQLEADIEPFRGILLGLFFLSVGMSLDLSVVAAEWALVVLGVLAFMAVKAAGIYGVARLFRAGNREAIQRAALFAQGGEFAFVLYGAAVAAGVMDGRTSAAMTAIVIFSMALTPLVVIVLTRLMPPPTESMDGIELAANLEGRVLMIGFGRFAQVVSQPLLARGMEVSLIETDVEMIRAAGTFGFKVYYGDGTRLDVLRASGATNAEAILVCVDNAEVADKIVELVKSEFPLAKLFVRAFDRGHSLRLIKAGVDYQIRETFESALVFGKNVLISLGVDEVEAAEIARDVRRRDTERLELQVAGGIQEGRWLMRGNMQTPTPEPFSVPRKEGEAGNKEAADAMKKSPKALAE
ncbi:monovalent cation:proton antiporter-2 (CPA2) family protein [Phenylobacterium sp. NIBR 498073]|uniref:monovalent cation:proton antiporter-2 (CPA2) family protein n=1 Tax=Phenylobacterium sp. NIBR 498073 TaxID=3015177 RepID=UPI0022B5C405|nr:monovalent cation:proton antiporter-2 (CPA2) family protein [Phenylobacterium sp. NIBR 498073]MBS0489082.1 cation:proton antiporter [Pseudomonadota bacterium]WGU39964.1 monovalent cation:proton antiporter-2 (CPA2) family protein [Phenylobacterium sp. NIBR 498073]